MNPFYLTGVIPEKYFCDRKQETETIVTHLTNQENILLASARRMGKTQLIRHIFAQAAIREQYYTFYSDIYATSSLQELVLFLGKEIYRQLVPHGKKALNIFLGALRSLSAAFGMDPVTGEPKFNMQIGDIKTPELTLEEIFLYLEQADKPCLFAIDEFQQIARYPEKNIEALLRTHIQKTNNCHFIFSGSDRHILEQMFSSYAKPFYNSAQPVYLGPINREIYEAFVRTQFQKADIEISSASIAYCYDLFEGNTYCNHKVFHDLYSFAKPGTRIEVKTVQEAVLAILEENAHAYGETLSSLTLVQRQVIIAIAKEKKATRITSGAFVRKYALPSPSSVQKAVEKLLDSQLITYVFQDGVKNFSVADKFLERWLQESY